jgi:hypothetical protein
LRKEGPWEEPTLFQNGVVLYMRLVNRILYICPLLRGNSDRVTRFKVSAQSFIYIALYLVSLCTIVSWLIPNANASGPRNDAPAEYRDGVVLLAFRSGVSPDREPAIIASIGGAEIKRIGVGVHVVHVGPGRVRNAMRLLKAYGEIRYAEPDYLQTLSGGPLPNDKNFGLQWALQNTGQTVNGSAGTAGADERAVAAWGVSTGSKYGGGRGA